MAQVPGRFVSVDRRPQTNDPHDPHASRANDRAQILRKKVLLFAVSFLGRGVGAERGEAVTGWVRKQFFIF